MHDRPVIALVDIGGTKLAAAVAVAGELKNVRRVPTQRDDPVGALTQLIDAVLETAQPEAIGISVPVPVDIEDWWFVGGQDNAIGIYSTSSVKILRNSFYANGLGDGDCIDFHAGLIIRCCEASLGRPVSGVNRGRR